MLTDGISDRKFPTFNIPIYPYKTYIFYCSETFLPENVPYHVQGSNISNHQGSQCITWSCLKVYFHLVNFNVCSLDSPNFCTYLTIQNIPLINKFLDLQNVPLFLTFLDLQNIQ